MAESASIRYNNPGAMWNGKIATKWGSTHTVVLGDGQSNHIAIFPTAVQGAAAQFDLWRSNYTGITLANAVKKWSGGNSSAAYLKFLKDKGVPSSTIITADFLSSPEGLVLMKAQAQWEAGKPYPMSDADWAKAQGMVFKTPLRATGTAAGALFSAGAISAASMHPSALGWLKTHWVIILSAVVLAGILIDTVIHKVKNGNN